MNDRVTWVDYLFALLTGLAMAAAICVFSPGTLDPSMWENAAIVAGLRPPRTMMPGLWRYVPGAMTPIMGAVGGGLLAFLVSMVLRHLFMIMVRPDAEHPAWRKFIAPAFSAVGAVMAVASEPVWQASQVLSPALMKLVFIAFATFSFLSWIHRGGWWRIYPVLFLMGAFSADTVYGFMLPIVFLAAHVFIKTAVVDGDYKPEARFIAPLYLPRWRMLFSYLGGFVAAAKTNMVTFFATGGAEQYGWRKSDAFLHYAIDYVREIASTASIMEWICFIGIVIIPLVLALATFPKLAVDEDEPVRFRPGLLMLAVGLIAYTQVSPLPSLWFWRWFPSLGSINDPFLLGVTGVLSAIVFAMAAASFTFGLHGLWTEEGTIAYAVLYWVPGIVAIAAVELAGARLPSPGVVRARQLIADGVSEIVREAGDAEFIFTDGAFDAAIELEAKRQGRELHPLNMMGSASGRDAALARRFLDNPDDVDTVAQGVPVLLRVWRDEREDGLDRAAMQLGFELWQRTRTPLPDHSGMLARPKGMSKDEIESGRKAARELSERVIALETAGDAQAGSKALRRAISDLGWRLSRFARLRNETELADRLDAQNSILKQMLRQIELERLRTFMSFTPRESLQIALKRADFNEARRFALTILKYNADDAEANFALGMALLSEAKYGETATYLRRCLKTRPDEPVVINNLSIVCRKLRRYDEALELAKRAVKLLPDSKETKQTLADAEKRAP